MKDKIVIFTILLFIGIGSVQAQTGFQGKRSEISLDVFSLAYFNELQFTYKYSINKKLALYGKFGTGSFSRNMNTKDINYLRYEVDQFNSNIIYSNEIVSGKTDFKSTSYEFGVLYMNVDYNTSLPVGMYSGVGIEISNGEMTDIYTLKVGINGSGNPQKFDVSQFKFVCYTGWDLILAGNITMDISLEAGIVRGTYTYEIPELPSLLASNPYSTFPQMPFIRHNQQEDWHQEDLYSSYPVKNSSFDFLVMPSIKIGYIF